MRTASAALRSGQWFAVRVLSHRTLNSVRQVRLAIDGASSDAFWVECPRHGPVGESESLRDGADRSAAYAEFDGHPTRLSFGLDSRLGASCDAVALKVTRDRLSTDAELLGHIVRRVAGLVGGQELIVLARRERLHRGRGGV